MRALNRAWALGAIALMLFAMSSVTSAQQSRHPPIIRISSASGLDAIGTSTYVEPQINLAENAYVFAVEMDLDGQIQVLHPDFPGLSVKISAHKELRLPNFFAGFNQAVPQGSVYSSASFYRYSPYGGFQDTRGTVLALASRAPFNLEAIESGGDWNIIGIRRLIENRTPLEALSVLANYLGAKGEPIGRDFMRFAGGAMNRYAYADYAYSPCDFYYGSFYGALGFAKLRTSRVGQRARIIGYDYCGVPIISYGPAVAGRFPFVPPRNPGDTTVFPKSRFPGKAFPRHPADQAPEGIFPLPHRTGQMGDVTVTAPTSRRGEPRIIEGYRTGPTGVSIPQGRMPVERTLPRTEPTAATGIQPGRYKPEPRVETPPARIPDRSPPPAPTPVAHERPSTPSSPPPSSPPPRGATPEKTPPSRQ